jgi:predicted O-methyltransferase YrrM
MSFEHIQKATRAHRQAHGCHAYTYSDGAALTALAANAGAKRVLELGTALGYTACCLAAAGPSVFVDTIERE